MAKQKVAIVATGQTKHRSRRRDVNISEMIYEAVKMALDEAQLIPKDIDAVVIGNMDHFEGINFSEMWTGIESAPGYLKPVVKVATGGTTGTSLALYGYYAVASGMYDKVLVVGWEKINEGGATTGIVTAFDARWERPALAGALGPLALMASMYMWEFGVTPEQAAKVTVKNRRNAANNPFAHLQQPNMTIEEVMNSPVISWPLRLHDCCPQSEGACAIVYAGEGVARKISDNLAWVKGVDTAHYYTFGGDDVMHKYPAAKIASTRLYKKVGIRNPLRDLDVAEVYEPSSWAELMWTEALGFCEYGQGGRLLDEGVTEMSGELPVNPSGGVIATNPIGATALIRVAEAAIQVRGLGGKRQVPDAELALAHGFGGSVWADLMILGKEP
ncbi:MAG: thiolase family protein [Candidatus Freyarchaeota archaeon]|nr:thiolase family protein [Candidatus Jordarchaeia archaeon]MBS7268983.1 thiolase family protein [Candidatus Jordarchaeia archaeon]MBS7281373.1 thiolase family protein [Candidatus Jordarchaeia archaeon]